MDGKPALASLGAAGARPQRLLWASTSTKDKTYSEVKYIEALIAPDTVNTLPPETLAAYRDHGDPAMRIEEDLDEAQALPARLAALASISMAWPNSSSARGYASSSSPTIGCLPCSYGAPRSSCLEVYRHARRRRRPKGQIPRARA